MSTRQFDTTVAPKVQAAFARPAAVSETATPDADGYGRLCDVALGAGVSLPQAQAAALSRSCSGHLGRAGDALLHLQRLHGNRYVQRIVSHARQEARRVTTPAVQTKLMLGPADDRYEREADYVAQLVVDRSVQRQTVDTNRAGRPLRIRPIHGAAGRTVDANVQQTIDNARGGGRFLPGDVRLTMEQAMGLDFSRVRLHTDARADHINRALQARAFTTGQDIFLRRGEYAPGSRSGQAVLAHELTHVVQQTGKGVSPPAGHGSNVGLGQVIQRLIAVPQHYRLYVSAQWLDDRENATIPRPRDFVKDKRSSRLAAFLAVLNVLVPELDKDPWTTEIVDTNANELLQDLDPRGSGVLTYGEIAYKDILRFRKTLRGLIARDLDLPRSVTIIDDVPTISLSNVQQVWQALRRYPVPMPRELIAGTPDLEKDLNELHVCTLIALATADPSKSVGIEKEWSREDKAAYNATSEKAKKDEAVYIRTAALHWEYFLRHGLLYDDASTHPGLFAEWGYSLIFSGRCSFRGLPGHLPPGLVLRKGKGYIFDVTGHTVYVKMLQNVDSTVDDIPVGSERKYFEFHDQKWNWNKFEENETKVSCIYGKR